MTRMQKKNKTVKLEMPKGILADTIVEEFANFEMPVREGIPGPKPELKAHYEVKLLRMTNLDSRRISAFTGIPCKTLWSRLKGFQKDVEQNEDKFIDKNYIPLLLDKTRELVEKGTSDFSMFADAAGYSDHLAVKLVNRLFDTQPEKELQAAFFLVAIQIVEHILDKKRKTFSVEFRKAFELKVKETRASVISKLADTIIQADKDSPEQKRAARMLKDTSLTSSLVAYI